MSYLQHARLEMAFFSQLKNNPEVTGQSLCVMLCGAVSTHIIPLRRVIVDAVAWVEIALHNMTHREDRQHGHFVYMRFLGKNEF